MWEEAIHYLEQDLSLTPHDLGLLNDLSICYWNQGACGKCFETLRRLLEVDSSSWFTLDKLCVVSGELGRWDDAVTYGEEAVRRGGFRFGESLGNLAHAYIEAGRHDDAIPLLVRALRIDPNNSELENLHTRAIAGRRESDTESGCCDNLMPRTTVDLSAHFETAERLKCEGRFDEAIEELRSALRLDPGCSEVIRTLARLFYHSKQFSECISSFIHAEARGVNLDADDLFMLGHAYASKSFHHKALESYDRSMARAEKADTHFARGTSYQKLQDFNNAERCYLDVLRLNPDHSEALFSRASVLAEKGDFPKALLEYEKWITMRRGDASTRHSIAVAQLNNGNPSGALEEVCILLNENPDDSEACFLKGYAYAELRDVQKAGEALERCLKLNTHHPLALSLLLNLKKA